MQKTIFLLTFFLFTLLVKASKLTTYSVENLKTMLTKDFHPYPAYGDKAWGVLPDSIRMPYIHLAEQKLNDKWESLPVSYFMEFAEYGNRNNFQNIYFAKRTRLNAFAMAELLEAKGRFLLPLLDGIFSICEETWWGLPAHYNEKLPTNDNQTVALYVAQTAGDMAMIYSIFSKAFDEISPLINQRIKQEINRRMLIPCHTINFGWKTNTSNWNPWITSHWITCVLLMEKDAEQKAKDIKEALNILEYYYSHYNEDGGCDEGPGYWGSSCGSFFNCNYLLYKASKGQINIKNDRKFRNMGEFICHFYIGGDNHFINFGDASPQTKLNPGLVYEYGQFINSSLMKSFGATKAHEALQNGRLISDGKGSSFQGFLYTILSAKDIISQTGKMPFIRDYLFPDLQVFLSRENKDSDRGLFFAIKGGKNNENHNHNDIGNYIVYANGKPLLIDVGAMTYSKDYFTAKRYNFWAVNSNYHNTPVINGVTQKAGKEFYADKISSHYNKRVGSFTLNVSHAYPKESGVSKWIRTVSLYRKESYIQFSECFQLQEYQAPSYIVLMTSCLPQKITSGILQLNVNEENYQLIFNPQKISATVEKVNNKDSLIQKRWGNLYRIKLTILSKKLSGKVNYSLAKEDIAH